MSAIARTALRIAAYEAIMGRTLARDRVHDSAIDGLDTKIDKKRTPFITITTDDDVREGKGRDTWSMPRKIDLVIEVAVFSTVKVEDDDVTPGATTTIIPQTDFGLEWTLDIIESQIERALFSQDTAWGALFFDLVLNVSEWKSRRGASAEEGLRFAARQINITLDVVEAPKPGAAIIDGPYQAVLAAMEAQPNRAELGALLRAVLEGTDKPEWERMAEAIAISRKAAETIGIAPVDLTETDEPAEMDQATTIDNDHDDGAWTEPEA